MRTVSKKYLALVEGAPKDKEGVIEYAIRPSKKFRLKKVAMKTAPTKRSHRVAKTLYKVRQLFGDKFALLEVTPKTGRTHQIRVHLSAIGHPVVGDSLYGSKTKIPKRHFLHAYYLKFTSPSGGELAFEVGLPNDLLSVIKNLSRQ